METNNGRFDFDAANDELRSLIMAFVYSDNENGEDLSLLAELNEAVCTIISNAKFCQFQLDKIQKYIEEHNK